MNDIAKLLVMEGAAAESAQDDPIPPGAHVTRPNQTESVQFSVTLNPDELTAVEEKATLAGVPPTALVRSWILDCMREERGELIDPEAELLSAQRHLDVLGRHLSRHGSE